MNEKLQNILIIFASIIILIILIVFSINLIKNNQPSKLKPNQVAEIIDGDTFRLENGDIIRLLCVDTPEKGEEGYDEAVSFLGGRLLYEDLVLEGNETDRYGRLLRWVWVNGSLVNKEIVDEGYGELFIYDNEEECGEGLGL